MDKIELLAEKLKNSEIDFAYNEPLSSHSTFKIGGTATLAAFPNSVNGLTLAIDAARSVGVRGTVVGNGSNILFSGQGFDGLVIFTVRCNKTEINGNRIYAECGASFTRLAVLARDAELSGLEFAYGIPGTVGGAVYMNAGAYGGEVCRILKKATVFDSALGRIVEYGNEACCFGYRTSVFAKSDSLTVLSAEFELGPSKKSDIEEKMNGFMFSRREKQPIEFPNAGSTFKRPEGYFAGKLIEDAGLKGFTVGGAQVSSKHAGFIVNVGGATAEDVLRLIEHVRKTVLEKFGVELECEIKYVY